MRITFDKLLTKSVETMQFPFKCVYTKLFPTLFIKGLADVAQLTYLLIEIKLCGKAFDEIKDEFLDFMGHEQPVGGDHFQDNLRLRFRSIIRREMRTIFILLMSCEASRYLGAFPGKSRIKSELLIEEYALKILPPIQMVENNRDESTDNGCACGNERNNYLCFEHRDIPLMEDGNVIYTMWANILQAECKKRRKRTEGGWIAPVIKKNKRKRNQNQ